jgi:hypothetical protein
MRQRDDSPAGPTYVKEAKPRLHRLLSWPHFAGYRINYFGSLLNTQWETCQATQKGCLVNVFDPTNRTPYAPPAQCYQGNELYAVNEVIFHSIYSRECRTPLCKLTCLECKDI